MSSRVKHSVAAVSLGVVPTGIHARRFLQHLINGGLCGHELLVAQLLSAALHPILRAAWLATSPLVQHRAPATAPHNWYQATETVVREWQDAADAGVLHHPEVRVSRSYAQWRPRSTAAYEGRRVIELSKDQPKEKAAEAMSVASSGNLKSADDRNIAAYRHDIKGECAVITNANDDGDRARYRDPLTP